MVIQLLVIQLLVIQLNGDRFELPGPCTVARLLELRNLTDKHVAVEVNGEVIPRARHDQCQLAEGDRLEVVSLVGGG